MPKSGETVNVYNLDVVMLAEKADRMALEVEKSVSAGLNEFNQFDQTRLTHFVADMTSFVDFSSQQNDIDLPHSHPTPRPIGVPKAKDEFELENEAANLLRAEILRFRENVVQSQSSVRAAGWMAHDLIRIRAYIARISNLLSQYIAVILPVDRPETFDRDAGSK